MSAYHRNMATLRKCQLTYDHQAPQEWPEDEAENSEDEPDYQDILERRAA